ncbi:MAG TPA: DUF4440 domain-containing protein [Vicinamibacteria bacterium]|nr:DUF4440 domain-containing protein [Vicinamibacteria bacterium]
MGMAVLAALAVAAVAGAQQAEKRMEPALSRVAADFEVAINAKDAAKAADHYTDDAVFNAPNAPAVRGRAEIQKALQGMIDAGLTSFDLTPAESAISGSVGYETGTYTVTIKQGATTITDKGKYLVVLKKVGNVWRVAHDMFNSDLPAPPAPAPPAK